MGRDKAEENRRWRANKPDRVRLPPITDTSNVKSRPGGTLQSNGQYPKGDVRTAFESTLYNGEPVLITRSGRRVDLNATVAGRRFVHIIHTLVDQLGGPDNVTPAEFELIRRASALSVDLAFQEADQIEAQGKLDPLIYRTHAETQRRLLQSLGLRRRARNINPKLIEARAEVIEDED